MKFMMVIALVKFVHSVSMMGSFIETRDPLLHFWQCHVSVCKVRGLSHWVVTIALLSYVKLEFGFAIKSRWMIGPATPLHISIAGMHICTCARLCLDATSNEPASR